MKTVRILASFEGYPNGKDEEHFVKDTEPTLDDAFADLIIGKGLATEIPGTAQPEPEHLLDHDHHEAEPQAEPEQKDTAA